MITRRRGRTMNNPELQSLEMEVVDVVEADKDLPSLSERFPADNNDTAGIELENLVGMENLEWTFERDAGSPFFDIDLAGLGLCGAMDQDPRMDASVASSPERMSSHLQIKNRRHQSSHMINKNAIAARLNRLKKKEYITGLERKVGALSTENNMLKQENSQLTKRVEELEDETRVSTQTTTTMPYPENL